MKRTGQWWRAPLAGAVLAAVSVHAETVRIEADGSATRAGAVEAQPKKPETPPSDGVAFRDGDCMRGQLVSLDPAGGRMQWGHQASGAAAKTLEFSTDGARELWLAPRPATGMREHSAMVALTNGDLLAGDVVALDKASLTLDTWYAGKLVIRRAMVAGIEMTGGNADKAGVVYQGPVKADEWGISKSEDGFGRVAVKDGAIELKAELPPGMQIPRNARIQVWASAVREIEGMPAAARIEFDAEWPGARPQFRVAFFSPKDRQRMFLMIDRQMRLMSDFDDRPDFRNETGGDWTGGLPGGRGHRARFSVLVDSAKRQCAVLVNGRLAAKWENIPEGLDKLGNCIHFSARSGTNPFRISNIRVAKWDGRLPFSSQQVKNGPVAEADFVGFANGDGLSGEIQSVRNGRLKMVCAYGPMEIPLTRAAVIIPGAPGGKPQVARRETGNVRLLLRDGRSLVTLKLDRLADGRVGGASENFGTAAFTLGALDRIELNIHDDEAAPGSTVEVSDPASEGGNSSDDEEDEDDSGVEINCE